LRRPACRLRGGPEKSRSVESVAGSGDQTVDVGADPAQWRQTGDPREPPPPRDLVHDEPPARKAAVQGPLDGADQQGLLVGRSFHRQFNVVRAPEIAEDYPVVEVTQLAPRLRPAAQRAGTVHPDFKWL